MQNKVRADLCAGIILIALAVMTIVSCGEEITKATNVSQVVDAHFKYEDIRFEYIEPKLYFTGKITNNSGVNLRQANFDAWCVVGGEQHTWDLTIRDFINGSTRTFDKNLGSFHPPECDDIAIEYRPQYD